MKKRPNMTSAALKKLDCGIRGQKLVKILQKLA